MNLNTKHKILYLDDEKENLDGFYYSFMDEYEIFRTKTPDKALKYIENEPIEVMIVDQKMPLISGIDLVKDLKKKHPDIIYILITAYASLKEAIQAVNEANIFRFISKPWNDNQIRNTLNEAIESYTIKKQNKELLAKLKKQNEELQKAYRIAEKSNRLKTAFLANISHEIRTPLNAIVGFSSLFAHSNVTKEKQQVFSGLISKNSNSLLQIIDQIVNVSKLETDQINLNITPLSITNFLDNLYNQFKVYGNDSIEFLLEFPNEISDKTIKTDKIFLNQVMENLIKNAFKFTKKGHVKIGISYENERSLQDKNIHVSKNIFETEKQKMFFFVEDSGQGIHCDFHKEVFEPFRKLSDDNANVIGGIGLGLYEASKIVQKLNGELFLKSEPGKGANFYFYLNG